MASTKKGKTSAQPVRKAAKAALKGKPAEVPKKSKVWIVPAIMLAVLLGVGAQIYLRARHLASLKFDLERVARVVPQGRDQGQAVAVMAVAGDKAGNAFVLEDDNSAPRLQRFDPQLSPQTLVYKAQRPDQALQATMDLDVDAQGQVYVLLKDGRVLVLSNDLQFIRQFRSGAQSPSALTVNSQGRIYVASAGDNRVLYFNPDGSREGEFGAPGTDSGNLVAPFRMRATANDELMVVERIEGKLRGKVFSPGHALRRTFPIDNLPICEPIKLGINNQGKAFLNDHMGSRGVLVYDVATGKFFGESQATKDGQKFVSPGAGGANRFGPEAYVHTVVGLIKCILPTPGSDD